MSSTNKTEHYNLPQFIGSDVPTWLGDFNSAMTAIDSGINAAATSASGAQNALNAKANISTLATVETGTTASEAYAVGEYLVYNGILYKVISEIQSGQTLTPGTNISATNAGAELTALNNGLTPIIKTYGHGVTVYKIGRICVLEINEPSGLSHSKNEWNTYAVLDSQFYPIGVDHINAVVANNTADSQTSMPLQLRIDITGNVKVYNYDLSNLQAVGIVTYISKN